MKNNLAFKFIAIILCAASLLGTIGSITGVIVLTSGDLYNKTVEQVKEERIQENAMHYADSLARMYASTALGGCPESMTANAFDTGSWFASTYPNYGYRILDDQGQVLSSYNEALKGSVREVSVPAAGQYMHLVSVQSESQIRAQETEEKIEEYTQDYGPADGQVPADGIVIDHVMLVDQQGRLIYEAEGRSNGDSESTYYYPDGGSRSNGHEGNYTGYLFYNQNGELVYNSFFEDYAVTFPETEVAEYLFVNSREGFVFSDRDPEGLGVLFKETDNLRFISYPVQRAEDVISTPAVVGETVPEESAGWAAETIPGREDVITIIAPDGSTMEIPIPGQEAAEATEAMEESAPAETTVPEQTMETVDIAEAEKKEKSSNKKTKTPSSASAIPTTAPEETEPVLINGKTLDHYQVNIHQYWDPDTQEHMTAEYVFLPMPEMTVELYIDTAAMRDNTAYELLEILRQVRNYLLPAIGACLLTFAVFAVYLCTAAGRKPRTEEIRAGGLNRIPLDLYLGGGGFAIALIVVLLAEGMELLLRRDFYVGCGFAVAGAFFACLIFVAFCFAFVAQIKTPGGFWWRNTLCGHFIRLFMQFAVWLERFLGSKFFPWLGRAIKWLWRVTVKTVIWSYHAFENSILWVGGKTGKIFRWIGRKLHRFLSMLPLTWQWLLVGFFLVSVLIIGIDAFKDGHNDMAFPIALMITFAGILYASHCFGLLAESTKRMSKGDLDVKVDDKLMIGCFKEFAGDLNDLADVAVVAAQKQLKSERMKTELITNVSHDIKTPLTSIINYVDLLQKPHSEEEEQQYLEVLDRQSQRLKKLIEDLMEMSKANTGNMQVEITRVDAVESVNQALGEFADKLSRARLIPVFRHEEDSVPMMADGRLVWRVMSNLLSNAVKYAMPGTRLYIDLMTLEGKVVISLKNISREELNIDADELMERFVRGDDSRNTEGSGLGLNIAKSLMELQKGQLQLLVDGDLFKVTLIFPGM